MTSIQFISALLTEEKNSHEIYDRLLQVLKDLELLEKYKRVMCEPILDIMKELKQLDKIKVLLVDYNNGKLGYINFTQEVIEVLTND